jgi:hypothetical protein
MASELLEFEDDDEHGGQTPPSGRGDQTPDIDNNTPSSVPNTN